jgi:hypothetical protein
MKHPKRKTYNWITGKSEPKEVWARELVEKHTDDWGQIDYGGISEEIVAKVVIKKKTKYQCIKCAGG